MRAIGSGVQEGRGERRQRHRAPGNRHTQGDEVSRDSGLSDWDTKSLRGLPAAVFTNPGQGLREARRWARVSQRDLASRAGCSQSRIARIETGGVQPPVDFFERLLALCGLVLQQRVEPGGPSQRAKLARRRRQLADIDTRMRLQRHRRREVNVRAAEFARGLENLGLTQSRRRSMVRTEMSRLRVELRSEWLRIRGRENRRMTRLVERDHRQWCGRVEAAGQVHGEGLGRLLAQALHRDATLGRHPRITRHAGDREGIAADCSKHDHDGRGNPGPEAETKQLASAEELAQAVERAVRALATAMDGGPSTSALPPPLTALGWMPQVLWADPESDQDPDREFPQRGVLALATTAWVRARICENWTRDQVGGDNPNAGDEDGNSAARGVSSGRTVPPTPWPRPTQPVRLRGTCDGTLLQPASGTDIPILLLTGSAAGPPLSPASPWGLWDGGVPTRHLPVGVGGFMGVLHPAAAGARAETQMLDELASRDARGRRYPAHLAG